MPVSELQVREGYFKGKEPHRKNIDVIRTLNSEDVRRVTAQILRGAAKTKNSISIPEVTGDVFLATKRAASMIVPTNASEVIDCLSKDAEASWWRPSRPVVVAQYGPPGTGKNVGVKKFAESLWKFYKRNNPKFVPFPLFFRVHNFATMTTKESISKFMGASKGYEGGMGDLVSDIKKGAQVFHLDEFHLAHSSIIQAFGGLFEEGELNDNSGAYAKCSPMTFFFLSANFSDKKQDEKATEILQMESFHQQKNQSLIEDQILVEKLEELKKLVFSGSLQFIGDRCHESLLTYLPDQDSFRSSMVQKFLSDFVCKNLSPSLNFKCGWTQRLVNRLVEEFASRGISNRSCRNLITKHLKEVVRGSEEVCSNQHGLLVFDFEGEFREGEFRVSFFPWTPELKSQVDPILLQDCEEFSPESKEDVEIELEEARKAFHVARRQIPVNVVANWGDGGGGAKALLKVDQKKKDGDLLPPPIDVWSLFTGGVVVFLLFFLLNI